MAFQQQSVGEDCLMLSKSKTVAGWLWVLNVSLSGWVGCYSKMSAILELLLRKHGKRRHFLAEEILQVGGKD